MSLIGNIIWLILGGLVLALGYVIAGVIMFIFIITIPFALQSFKLAGFSLWPFGRVMVDRGGASGGLSAIGNVIWVLLAGLWLALGHLLAALLLAITIIAIPFASAHVKLAGAALTPFGKSVMSKKQAEANQYRIVVGIEPLGQPR